MRRVVIIGAAGQARETAWVIREMARSGEPIEFVGFVVTDLDQPGRYASTNLIRGDFRWLRDHRDSFDELALGIGTPAGRLAVGRDLLVDFGPDFWPPLIHPSAMIDQETFQIGFGAFVGPGCVVTVNVVLEPFAMLNFGVTVGHETRIGRGSVVNPGANLSGGVILGDGVLVGTGAQVLQYVRVADHATVGAGAVVTRDVPPSTTVVGVPAREHRRNRPSE